MTGYIVFRTILDFGLLFFGLWAIGTLAANLIIEKCRPGRTPSKRQKKMYIHSIADDR